MVSVQYRSPIIAGRLSPASFTSASSSTSPSPPPSAGEKNMHHEIVQSAASSAARSQSTSRKYACPHCTRVFARAFNLKTHIATHDPHRQKPHVCPHTSCDHRSFSRKHDLARHLISIHHGEQPASPPNSASSSPSTPPPATSVRLPPMRTHPPPGAMASSIAATNSRSPQPQPPASQHLPRITHPSLAPLLNPPYPPTHAAPTAKHATNFPLRPTHVVARSNRFAHSSPMDRDDIYSEDSSSEEEDELLEDDLPQRLSPQSESSRSVVSSYSHGSNNSGVGVAAGHPRGWCGGCGKGWVGREKRCPCGEEIGHRDDDSIVRVKREELE